MGRTFKFIIHIGTEKTGTTTLQNLLSYNHELLKSRGFFYLRTPERIEARGITAASLGDQQPDEFLKDLGVDTPEQRQKFRDATERQVHETLSLLPESVSTVIVSSEHFHSRLRHPEQVARVRKLLIDHAESFQIVCYLRHQASLVESYYSTALKNGTTLTLKDTAEQLCKASNHYYNYQMLLDLWSNCFGAEAITPRIFDKHSLEEGDIIKDFLSASKINIKLQHPQRKQERYNESLTPLGQSLLKGINIFQSSTDITPDLDRCKKLASSIIKEFPGSGERLDKQALENIESEFETSNTEVKKHWFSDRQGSLFHSPEDDQGVMTRGSPVTRNQLEITSQVIDYLESNSGKPAKSLNHCADTLKTLALRHEEQDRELAWKLMSLARRIRPGGPFIKQKVLEYNSDRQRPFYRFKKWIKR